MKNSITYNKLSNKIKQNLNDDQAHSGVRSSGGSPAVSVPQEDADVVDDEGLAEFDLDPGASVLLYGVSGKAVVQVVVLRVSVK